MPDWKQHVDAGHEVRGVDIAEPMIRHVRARFGSDRFRLGDIEHIPFADDTFGRNRREDRGRSRLRRLRQEPGAQLARVGADRPRAGDQVGVAPHVHVLPDAFDVLGVAL